MFCRYLILNHCFTTLQYFINVSTQKEEIFNSTYVIIYFFYKISYAFEIVIEIKTYKRNSSGTLIATFSIDSLKLKSKWKSLTARPDKWGRKYSPFLFWNCISYHTYNLYTSIQSSHMVSCAHVLRVHCSLYSIYYS